MKRFALIILAAAVLLTACAPASVLPLPAIQPAAILTEAAEPDVTLAPGQSVSLPVDGSVTNAALASGAVAVTVDKTAVTAGGSTLELEGDIISAWLVCPEAGGAALIASVGSDSPATHAITVDGCADNGSVPGFVSDITSDGYILITDTFNVMGLRRGTARFTLTSELALLQLPGSLWIIEPGRFVTVSQELEVSPMDGCGCGGTDVLSSGTQLRPTATDRELEILYESDGGIGGTLSIDGYENGLPVIDGKPETEWFSDLSYTEQ